MMGLEVLKMQDKVPPCLASNTIRKTNIMLLQSDKYDYHSIFPFDNENNIFSTGNNHYRFKDKYQMYVRIL